MSWTWAVLCLVLIVPGYLHGVQAQLDCPMDICVVIDASDSITNTRFAQIIATLNRWLTNSVISEDKVRWSFTTFSDKDEADSIIPFTGARSEIVLAQLERGGGRTYADVGLRNCTDRKEIIDPEWERQYLLIIITDGNSNDPNATKDEIERVTDQAGGSVFAITIGAYPDDPGYDDRFEYEEIVPEGRHRNVSDFNELLRIAEDIFQEFTCCGDNEINGGEQCDDGNNVDGDGCESDCRFETPPPVHDVGPCDHCTIINGVGFNPSDNCGCYITCLFAVDGALTEFVERTCWNKFWDQDLLTCVSVNQTSCATDPCADPNVSFWPVKDCCNAFWVCGNGRTITVGFCDAAERWNNIAERCVIDQFCVDDCRHDEGPQWDCHLLPNTNDPSGKTYFAQQALTGGGTELILMVCPVTTAFDPVVCDCSIPIAEEPICMADFIMNFEQDPLEDVKYQTTIVNVGGNVVVDVFAGCGTFDTSSRLIVPRYANMEWMDEWAVKVVFDGEGNNNDNGPLFSNSGCVEGSSIEIRLDINEFTFEEVVRAYVLTVDDEYVLELLYADGVINEVYLQYVDGLISFAIVYESGAIASNSVAATGWVIRRHCAVQWGYGFDDRHFIGKMYWGEVWLCVPDDFLP